MKVTDTTAGGSWHNAYKDYGEEGTPTLYAQTGTRAQMRKPVVRMWNTLGTNGVTGNLSEYYAESEGAVRQLNVHVENRYWWDHTAQNVTTKNSGDWYHEGGWWERLYHTYSVDGGQQGDLVMPVVTVVLPENIVPLRANGEPYSRLPDVEQGFAADDWSVNYAREARVGNTGQLTNNMDAPEAWRDFKATVTYENVKDEGTPAVGNVPAKPPVDQYRFVIRFEARGDVDTSAETAEIGRAHV